MHNEPETIYLPLAEIHELHAAGKLPEGKFIRISDFPGQPPYGDQIELDEEDEAALQRVEARNEEEARKKAARKQKSSKAKNKKP